ncbi:MAG: response regulator [Kofleriaceae bacterium]|nr:MAG: response regulator [Kofleriaceae bacterium]
MGSTAVKKILVVEDDPVNLQILSDFLAAHGYEMRGAATGPEGVAQFWSERPDLMLVDVQLPRKNGFEVCWEIKRTPEGEHTPVLLMSAVYSPRDEQDRFAAPSLAAGYLSKPFDLGDLLSRVKRLIGDASPSA